MLEEDISVRVTRSGKVSHRTASAFSLRQEQLPMDNRRARGRTGSLGQWQAFGRGGVRMKSEAPER